jgi:hypothetical protein
VTLPASILGAPFVARLEVRVNDRGQFSVFGIDVGGAAAAIGQVIVDQNKPERGVVCSHPLAAVDGWRRGEAEFVIPPDTGTVEFSSGWYPVEHRSDGMPFRWTESHAVLVTPMEMGRDTLVEVEAEPLGYRARRPSPMTLEVNGRPIGARPMNGGRETLQWTVPAEDWRAGLNEIALDIEAKRPSDVGLSADHRLLGASVSRIRLTAAPRARNR